MYNLKYIYLDKDGFLIFILFDFHPDFANTKIELCVWSVMDLQKILINRQVNLSYNNLIIGEKLKSTTCASVIVWRKNGKEPLVRYKFDYHQALADCFKKVGVIKIEPYLQELPKEIENLIFNKADVSKYSPGSNVSPKTFIEFDSEDEYALVEQFASYV